MGFPSFAIPTPDPDGINTLFSLPRYASDSLQIYQDGLLMDKACVTELDPVAGTCLIIPPDGPLSVGFKITARYLDPLTPDGPVVDTLTVVIADNTLRVLMELATLEVSTVTPTIQTQLDDLETLSAVVVDSKIFVEVCECP